MRFFLAFLIFPAFVFAQSSSRTDTVLIFSNLMQREVRCAVYSPALPDSIPAQQPLPVLYLLHGLGGNHLAWLTDGALAHTADSLIAAGILPPTVIVMPDAWNTYYMNSISDSMLQYEDFFTQELILWAETTYHCGGSRERRAIGGLSMGGYGALMYSLHSPTLFGLCLSVSAGLRTDTDLQLLSEADWNLRYGAALGQSVLPTARVGQAWQQNSVLAMVSDSNNQPFQNIFLLLDCGDSDPFTANNLLLHNILVSRNTPHTFWVLSGGHTWEYWKSWLPMALNFAGQLFQNTQPIPIFNENNE